MRQTEFLEELDDPIDRGGTVVLVFTRRKDHDRDRALGRLARMLRRHEGIESFHLDLGMLPQAAGRFTIYSTPAVAIYRRGKMVSKVEGSLDVTPLKRTLRSLSGS